MAKTTRSQTAVAVGLGTIVAGRLAVGDLVCQPGDDRGDPRHGPSLD